MNVLMNWAWIYGNMGLPAMGVEGAGYATTCTSVLMVLVGAFVAHRVVAKQGCRAAFCGPDWLMIKEVLLLGVPFALHLLVEVGSFNAVTVLSGILGEVELAAHQAALQLASVSFMLPLGIALAGSIRVSNCRGAKDWPGARLAVRVNVGLGFVVSLLNTCVFFVFAEEFVAVFTSDQEVIEIGATLVRIAGVFQLSDGMQVIGACCYRGYGNTRTPFITNLVGHWALAVPLGYLLAFHWGVGVAGLWVGLTLGLTAVALFLIRRVLNYQV
jgi:MATE family multidrug resistance protein